MPHAGGPDACFTDDGESLRKNLIQRFLLAILAVIFVARVFDCIGNLGLEKSCPLAELFIGELLNPGFELVDSLDQRANRLQEPLVAAAENFC